MTSIAFFNNKGGVGKTTLVCNLASYFALEENKKVLVIDADPQSNASIYMWGEEAVIKYLEDEDNKTISSILYQPYNGDGYLPKADLPILHSDSFGVDFIMGDTSFSIYEDFLSKEWSEGSNIPRSIKSTFVFSELLRQLETEYDFVFFDLGPSLGAINRVVLVSCNFFVIPLSSDIFSLKAINNISQSLSKWKTTLQETVEKYHKSEGYNERTDKIKDLYNPENPRLLGYTYQQYITRSTGGERRPVRAYDNIISKIPGLIKEKLLPFFSDGVKDMLEIGSVPNFSSMIPLSQTVNKPVFKLDGSDGIIGAHYKKILEYGEIMNKMTQSIINNLEAYGN